MSLFTHIIPRRGGLTLPTRHLPAAPMSAQNRADWFFRLGSLALKDSLWSAARSSFQSHLHQHGDGRDVRYNLALCDIATGNHRQALEHLVRADQLQANDRDVTARLLELAAIELHWASLSWFDPDQARAGQISLEPLAERHLPALHYQLRDPAIARSASIPTLHNAPAVHHWFSRLQQDAGHYHYAVMHQSLGFAGLISGNIAKDLAWLNIWIGHDCQRQGIAPKALKLARGQLNQAGINHIISATVPRNAPSHSALRRAGFARLPQQGRGDGHPVQFWHSPLHPWLPGPDTATLQNQLDQLDACFEVTGMVH